MRPRSKGRKFAMQMLFQIFSPKPGEELVSPEDGEELQQVFQEFWQDAGEAVPDQTRAFSEEIVCGVLKNQPQISEAIVHHTKNWRLDRMPLVDLSILRLGTYEIFCGNTPIEVIVNEAVELAKHFSSSESGRFINAVLDAIAKDHGQKTHTSNIINR